MMILNLHFVLQNIFYFVAQTRPLGSIVDFFGLINMGFISESELHLIAQHQHVYYLRFFL